jgi:Family of unknown function (DUF6519)
MTSDRARVTYDPSRHYTGVIAQQGRVSLEADWNEAQAIGSEQLEARTLDLIGPIASPDQGYRIDVDGDTGDLRIRSGTVYLGGQRLMIGRDFCHGGQQDMKWLDWNDQRDTEWLDWAGDELWRDARDDDEPHELVYLLAREHEVSAVEDHALRDVALGGPDSAQRLRILQRVIRRPTSAPTWEGAWGKVIDEEWIPRGFRPDRDTRRLEPAARLQVVGHPAGGAEEPVDQGSYLGPNNQLIRVQIARIGEDGVPVLVWGFDNASFLYRLTSSEVSQAAPGSTTLRLATAPVDAFHQPAEHQAVEVLRSAASLDGDHDCIAASTGRVVKVTSAYAPDSRELVVGTELPAEYRREPGQGPPLFLRVWQGEFPCRPGKEEELGLTGIRIRLTALEDGRAGAFPVGVYWMIAVRPGVGPDSPALVYPHRILARAQPPDGPRQWLAPVAFVRWHPRSPATEDCIRRFDSLVREEERAGGSCTVRVSSEDVGGGWALQDVIDAHASRGHSTTICLEPGNYALPEPLRIGPQHGRLTIRAVRPGVVLRARPEAAARFLHGLIIAREAKGLRLEGLEVHPGHANFVLDPETYQHQPDRARHLLDAHRHRTISIGLHAVRCMDLAVRDCRFDLSIPASRDSARDERLPEHGLFAAGILGAEELRAVRVERCTFAVGEPITHARSRPHRGEGAEGAHHVALGFVQVPTAMAVPLDSTGDEAGPGEPRGSVSVPLLDDAVFHDNLFEHLTAPVVAIGHLGTLHADRNTVRSCHAGFWLVNQHASHVLTFLDRLVNQVEDAYRELAKDHLTALAELLVFHTTVLARTLPQELSQDPDAASQRRLQPPSTTEDQQASELKHRLSSPSAPGGPPPSPAQKESMLRRFREIFGRVQGTRRQPAEVVVPPGAALRCCLHITGNSLHSGSAPALVVLNTAPDSAASLILTGNQLRGYPRPGSVACLYLLRSCAASANVIANGEADHDDAASLVVLPRHHHHRHQAAITGNVLAGEAHLPHRPEGLPSWASLNSVTRS